MMYKVTVDMNDDLSTCPKNTDLLCLNRHLAWCFMKCTNYGWMINGGLTDPPVQWGVLP